MFSNVTGQGELVCDDATLPITNGNVIINKNSKSYVTAVDGSFIYPDGCDFGYHSTTSTYTIPYDLQERHKTYKILNYIMSEYKKHKKMYDINICGGSKKFSLYTLQNEAITIKMNTTLGISFFNNKENKIETIEKISDYASDILQDCVVEFLDKHSEEFMELVVSNVKRDVIQYAKQEGKKIKDQLEFVEMIEKMES